MASRIPISWPNGIVAAPAAALSNASRASFSSASAALGSVFFFLAMAFRLRAGRKFVNGDALLRAPFEASTLTRWSSIAAPPALFDAQLLGGFDLGEKPEIALDAIGGY